MGDDLRGRIREHLPATTQDLIEAIDASSGVIGGHVGELSRLGVVERGDDEVWQLTEAAAEDSDSGEDWEDTPVADADPSSADLTERERYLIRQLQTGTTPAELAEDIDTRKSVIAQHFRDLRRQGWRVYHDDTTGSVTIEGDHTLRSSEHIGTRTRKANRWWELRHNDLVRAFRALETPTATLPATSGHEDWVTHLTDLHAGDRVHGYEGDIAHETSDLPPLIDHITERSLALSDKHGSDYDVAHCVWTGDFVTNSGIYEGQFENLDAWLDEQLDILHDPLLRQIKTFANEFPSVHVACQPGNHGDIRASGSSKQANADLLLYKSLRNTVAALQSEGHYGNVAFTIGRAGSVTPIRLRGGEIHGQLRHGQDRDPQASTSARKKEWLSTILDSMNAGDAFDIAWMGHHHVSGRLPWNGPPVFITGSPKPSGEYPRKLGEVTGPGPQDVAHCHGVSDDGVTGVYALDTRHYDPV
jgi:Mn-dependent DtxR family transcriptional regulator